MFLTLLDRQDRYGWPDALQEQVWIALWGISCSEAQVLARCGIVVVPSGKAIRKEVSIVSENSSLSEMYEDVGEHEAAEFAGPDPE